MSYLNTNFKSLISGLLCVALVSASCNRKNSTDAGATNQEVSNDNTAPLGIPGTTPTPPLAKSPVLKAWQSLFTGSTTDPELARLLAPQVRSLVNDDVSNFLQNQKSFDIDNPDLEQELTSFEQELHRSVTAAYWATAMERTQVSSEVFNDSLFAKSNTPGTMTTNISAPISASRMSRGLDALTLSYSAGVRMRLHNQAYQRLVQSLQSRLSTATRSLTNSLIKTWENQESSSAQAWQNLRNNPPGFENSESQIRNLLAGSEVFRSYLAQAPVTSASNSTDTFSHDIVSAVTSQLRHFLNEGSLDVSFQQPDDWTSNHLKEIYGLQKTLTQEGADFSHRVDNLANHLQPQMTAALLAANEQWPDLTIPESKAQPVTTIVRDPLVGLPQYAIDEEDAGTSDTTSTTPTPEQLWLQIGNDASTTFDRVEGLANSAQTLLKDLGVNVDPEVQNTIQTVEHVGQIAQAGVAIAEAFATGGASAILGALGGAGSLLGGSSPDLSGINSQLNVIAQQQQVILETEQKIMNLLVGLSQQVEENFQSEMQAFNTLNSEIAAIGDILQSREWKSCESLLAAAHADVQSLQAGDDDLSEFHLDQVFVSSSSFFQFLQQNQYDAQICGVDMNHTLLENLSESSGGSDSGQAVMLTSNLRLIQVNDSSPTSANGPDFYYQPLRQWTIENNRMNGLSLPLRSLHSFAAKHQQLDSGTPAATETEVLISTQRLQRYTQGYLTLRPFLQFSTNQWTAVYDTDGSILPDAFMQLMNNSQAELLQSSVQRLKTLLSLIDSAIAQESIWSGEPILDLLADKVTGFLDVNASAQLGLPTKLVQAVTQNSVLLHNLFVYLVQAQGLNFDHDAYQAALDAGQTQALTIALGEPLGTIFGPYLTKTKAGHVGVQWAGNSEVLQLPSRQEIESQEIHYRAGMNRLTKLHDRVVEALVLMNLQSLSPETQQKLMVLSLISTNNTTSTSGAQ